MTLYLLKWGWSYSTFGPDDEHYEELWTTRNAAEMRMQELASTMTRACGIRLPTEEELQDERIKKAMDDGAWGLTDYRPPTCEIVALDVDTPSTESIEQRRRLSA